MHPEARAFLDFVRRVFPSYFEGKIVLDVGSGDINGNNQHLFTNCSYSGNDVISAPNVTIVSKTSSLPFESATFDTIVSSECFEHDPEYKESLRKIVDMLKPGGLFAFTCASTGRGEHGTRRTNPLDSYGALGNVEGWTDYYGNLTIDDVNASVPIDEYFQQWASYYDPIRCDLYFWGIKKGLMPIPQYKGRDAVLMGLKR
jgi:SAM-dependent methyltransferase